MRRVANDDVDVTAERLGEGAFELRLETRRLRLPGLEEQVAGRNQGARILEAERFGHPAKIGHDEALAAGDADTVQQRDINGHGFALGKTGAPSRT